jgi:hypothetical protein
MFLLIFTVALVVLVLIIPLILYTFGTAADGFARQSLFIIVGLALPFIAVSWTNILKYVDLWTGKKIRLQTADYDIKKQTAGYSWRQRFFEIET